MPNIIIMSHDFLEAFYTFFQQNQVLSGELEK